MKGNLDRGRLLEREKMMKAAIKMLINGLTNEVSVNFRTPKIFWETYI